MSNIIGRRQAMGLMLGGGAALTLGKGLPSLQTNEGQLTVEVAISAMDTVREPAEGNPFPTGPF